MTRPALLTLAAALLLCAACGNDQPTSPTTPTTPPAGPGTESFNAVMAPGGTAVRTFTASAAGTVTVTLNGTSPTTVVGLGVGIPGTATTGGCDMTSTLTTSGGSAPQLSVPVSAGDFCAGTFDLGTVGSNGVLVSMTIVHP